MRVYIEVFLPEIQLWPEFPSLSLRRNILWRCQATRMSTQLNWPKEERSIRSPEGSSNKVFEEIATAFLTLEPKNNCFVKTPSKGQKIKADLER